VGLRAGLNGRKISSPPGFNPGPSSPVAQSLYRLSHPAHSSRCIPVKKYIGLKCSCVLCVIGLFFVVSYVVRAVHKFDFRLFFFQTKHLINSEQCVFKKLRHAVIQTRVY